MNQNALDTKLILAGAAADFRQPAPLPKKKNPVTLIIGIVCKDAIVVATDSRTTFPSHVEDHAQKLRIIKFKHGQALVAWSGYTAFAVDTVDVLEQRAAALEPKNYRDVAEVAKSVIDEMRAREVAPYRGAMISVDSVQSHLRDNTSFLLMLAYYHLDQPYLYTLDFPNGTIYREQSHFATMGQNASLGSYLLKEYTQPGMNKELAIAIAVYVIESVGEHDKTVGGLTKVAVLLNPHVPSLAEHRAQQLNDADVLEISRIAADVKAWIRKRHTKQLKERLARQSKKHVKEMMEDIYADIQQQSKTK